MCFKKKILKYPIIHRLLIINYYNGEKIALKSFIC